MKTKRKRGKRRAYSWQFRWDSLYAQSCQPTACPHPHTPPHILTLSLSSLSAKSPVMRLRGQHVWLCPRTLLTGSPGAQLKPLGLRPTLSDVTRATG